jgi:hypothetical protein
MPRAGPVKRRQRGEILFLFVLLWCYNTTDKGFARQGADRSGMTGTLGMVYSAITLAIVGFVVGGVFRFRVLLTLVGVLLLLSIVFSLGHGFSFLETALTILLAQTIFQGTYFIGLAARSYFYRTDGGRDPAFRPPHDVPGDRSNFKVSDIPSKTPHWSRRFAQGTEQHPSHFRRP